MEILTVIMRDAGDRTRVMIEDYKSLDAARKSWDGMIDPSDVLIQVPLDDVVVSTGVTKTVAQTGENRDDTLSLANLK